MRRNMMAEIGRYGYSKKDICGILRVSFPTLRRYIDGGSIPSDKLKIMTGLFDRSADYLLEDFEQQE